MKLRTIFIVLIFTAPLMFCSPAAKTNGETQKMVDEFFKAYKIAGHKDAVTSFLGKNKWITNDDANKVGTQIDEIVSQIGRYYGQEKVSENYYGESVIQYIYLVRYERQPLKFIFRFYKPNDKWGMQSFNYEIDFMKELDEAGKASRFKENTSH